VRLSRVIVSAAIVATFCLAPASAGFAQTEAATSQAAFVAAPAGVSAPSTLKEYKNCDALHKKYPHGVGKRGAKDKVRGSTSPVKSFTVNTAVYNQNKKSDRDKDGVACEKK